MSIRLPTDFSSIPDARTAARKRSWPSLRRSPARPPEVCGRAVPILSRMARAPVSVGDSLVKAPGRLAQRGQGGVAEGNASLVADALFDFQGPAVESARRCRSPPAAGPGCRDDGGSWTCRTGRRCARRFPGPGGTGARRRRGPPAAGPACRAEGNWWPRRPGRRCARRFPGTGGTRPRRYRSPPRPGPACRADGALDMPAWSPMRSKISRARRSSGSAASWSPRSWARMPSRW